MPPESLYALSCEVRQLLEAIAEQDGEVAPEQEQVLDALNLAIEEKADAYCRVIADFEAQAGAVHAEVRRLQAREQALNASARRLRDRLKECLRTAGRERVRTPLFTVRLQFSPPSARWTGDPDEIPYPFRRVKVEFDAVAALKLLRAGGELPDRVEVTRGTTLVIK